MELARIHLNVREVAWFDRILCFSKDVAGYSKITSKHEVVKCILRTTVMLKRIFSSSFCGECLNLQRS